jgi:hypothetical protein
MSRYAVEFRDVSACIEFLYLILQNKAALRLDRSDFDRIIVSSHDRQDRFTVVIRRIQKSRLDLLRELARAPGTEIASGKLPTGQEYTINDFLQQVKLVRSIDSVGENGLAIALFKANEEQYQEWYTQLLDMGCRGIHVGKVEPCEETARLNYFILVESVPKGFAPPADWNQGCGWGAGRALVFYRLHGDEDCRVYVEWGYTYPLDDVDHIFEFDKTQCHTVLICADDPKNLRQSSDNDVLDAMRPQWLYLSEHDMRDIFTVTDRSYRLEVVSGKRPVSLKPLAVPGKSVLKLHVKKDGRGTANSVESIERDIAWHEQTIDDLKRDHNIAHQIHREPIYLAYIFYQSLQSTDKPESSSLILNRNFRRFLEKPYTHLRHLKYAFCDLPKEALSTGAEVYGLHVVIDTQSSSYNQIFTQLADAVFIQRKDWYEWGLPLYVQYGSDLRPRLDDPSWVPVMRSRLWQTEGHAEDEPVLLWVPPGATNHDDWQALFIKDTVILTEHECFGFLNKQFPAKRLAFIKDTPKHIKSDLLLKDTEVTHGIESLKSHILTAADEGIQAVEVYWGKVDKDIQRVQKDTKKLDSHVEQIDETTRRWTGDWSTFFNSVLVSNENLMRSGVEVFENYRKKHAKLVGKLTDYEKGLCDVKKKMDEDDKAIDAEQTKLDDLDKQCAAMEKRVKEKLPIFHKHHEESTQKINTAKETVNRLLTQKEKDLQTINGKIKALDGMILTLQKKATQLKDAQKELKQKEASEERLKRDNEALEKENEKKRNELKELETANQEMKEKIQIEIKTNKATEEQLENTRAKYGEGLDRVQARTEYLQGKKEELDRLMAEKKKCLDDNERQAKENKHKQDELGKVLSYIKQKQKQIADQSVGYKDKKEMILECKTLLRQCERAYAAGRPGLWKRLFSK